jgi:hypothetical protein
MAAYEVPDELWARIIEVLPVRQRRHRWPGRKGAVARSDVEERRSRDVHPDQIAAANSPNATATRWAAGASTASS